MEAPLPAVGRRRRRRRRTSEIDSAESGHAKREGEGGSSANGPADPESGHAIGPPSPDPLAGALARVRAALDRADRYHVWLEAEEGRTGAELSRCEGVSRARVCQVLRLRRLARAVVEDLRMDGRTGAVPTVADLRWLAGVAEAAQWERYERLLEERCAVGSRTARPGFQADFERARRWRALLEGEDRLTLADIAREEGCSPGRVAQVLNLLELAPEIIAVLDVEAGRLPKGVRRKDVRRIAWMASHEEQRREFEQLWPGAL